MSSLIILMLMTIRVVSSTFLNFDIYNDDLCVSYNRSSVKGCIPVSNSCGSDGRGHLLCNRFNALLSQDGSSYVFGTTLDTWGYEINELIFCYGVDNIIESGPLLSCHNNKKVIPIGYYETSDRNCQFYSNLQNYKRCDGYLNMYAIPICNLFLQEQGSYSAKGIAFLKNMRKCLQDNIGVSSSCDEIDSKVQIYHDNCLYQSGFSICDLDLSEQVKIGYKMFTNDWLDTSKGFLSFTDKCFTKKSMIKIQAGIELLPDIINKLMNKGISILSFKKGSIILTISKGDKYVSAGDLGDIGYQYDLSDVNVEGDPGCSGPFCFLTSCYDVTSIPDCIKIHSSNTKNYCYDIPSNNGSICVMGNHLIEFRNKWVSVESYAERFGLVPRLNENLNSCDRSDFIERFNNLRFSTYSILQPSEVVNLANNNIFNKLLMFVIKRLF